MYYINYIINLRGFVIMKRFIGCLNVKRLRNKCAMTCDLSPRPVGERVRERGYLAASLLSRLAAFTLAEVLVTLGIIGVVSAMTVPTLMQNYQRQSYVTQLHKNYNEMSQALLRYQTDKNAINLSEAGFDRTTPVSGYNFFKTYFKVVADCNDNFTPCMATTYKKLDGNTVILMQLAVYINVLL